MFELRRFLPMAALLALATGCGGSEPKTAAANQPSAATAQPPRERPLIDANNRVDFYRLAAFFYDPDDPWAITPTAADPSPIPAEILALDGREVSIVGLAMILDWQTEGVSEFILTIGEDACEFGVIPRVNEWIMVRNVDGWKARLRNGMDYLVIGTFHVEETVEDGKVIQLFSMDAVSVR